MKVENLYVNEEFIAVHQLSYFSFHYLFTLNLPNVK